MTLVPISLTQTLQSLTLPLMAPSAPRWMLPTSQIQTNSLLFVHPYFPLQVHSYHIVQLVLHVELLSHVGGTLHASNGVAVEIKRVLSVNLWFVGLRLLLLHQEHSITFNCEGTAQPLTHANSVCESVCL